MKGLVFTTFYAHCEEQYGADMLDDIIDDANLPNKGAYTSVGTYPFQEIVALITALVRRTGQSLPAVLEQFGRACFGKWVSYVPAHFENKDLFDILAGSTTSTNLKSASSTRTPSFRRSRSKAATIASWCFVTSAASRSPTLPRASSRVPPPTSARK
jgi:hypothetical protein